jgi:hypothetical protein
VAEYELISRNVLTDDDFASPQIKADVEPSRFGWSTLAGHDRTASRSPALHRS